MLGSSHSPSKVTIMSDTTNPKIDSGKLLESVVRVPISEMGTFHAELERLNRKAAKFGLDPITVKESVEELYLVRYHREMRGDTLYVGEELLRMPDDPEGRAKFLERHSDPCVDPSFVRMKRLKLSYPIVKLGNWAVISRIEPISPGVNLVFSITDDPRDRAEVQKHLTGEICCDHCKTARQRNDSYILRNLASPVDDPEYMEVGRSCLKDFTGIDPAAALFLAKMGSWCRVDDFYDPEDPGNFRGRVTGTSMRWFLARAAFCIDTWGFVSRSVARDECRTSTADDAQALPDIAIRNENIRVAWDAAKDRCLATAEKVLAWARGPLEVQGNDYLHNVKALLANDDIGFDGKHMAIAASAVQAWRRACEQAIEQEKAQAQGLCHVGVKGEKVSAILTMTGKHVFEHAYGVGCYVHLRDEQGNRLSWKASQVPDFAGDDDNVGRPFHAQFKVKEHSEYKGVPQTDISHMKIIGWVDEIGSTLPEPSRKAKKKAAMSM